MLMSNAAAGTLKIRDGADVSKMRTIDGVTSALNDTDVAQLQVNKLFGIAGISVVGDEKTTLTIKREAVES